MTEDQIVEIGARGAYWRAMDRDFDGDAPEWSQTSAQEAWRQTIRDALTALSAAGLAVVPVEPSEEMRKAAWEVFRQKDARRVALAGGSGSITDPGWETHYYRAMIRAAAKEDQDNG